MSLGRRKQLEPSRSTGSSCRQGNLDQREFRELDRELIKGEQPKSKGEPPVWQGVDRAVKHLRDGSASVPMVRSELSTHGGRQSLEVIGDDRGSLKGESQTPIPDL
jgi:hypothetical protein